MKVMARSSIDSEPAAHNRLVASSSLAVPTITKKKQHTVDKIVRLRGLGLSNALVAERLGISKDSCKVMYCRAKNPTKYKAYATEYYKKNKKIHDERSAKWRRDNPEISREYQKEWRYIRKLKECGVEHQYVKAEDIHSIVLA